MPKIRIKEKDNTTNPLVLTGEVGILYCDESLSTLSLEAPKVLSKEEIKTLSNSFLTEASKLGGTIIGFTNLSEAASYVSDRNQYDLKFILTSGTVTGTGSEATGDLVTAVDDIAEARKDCVVVHTVATTSSQQNVQFDEDTKAFLESPCGYITGDEKSFYGDEEKDKKGKYVLPFYAKTIHKIGDEDTTITAGEAYILAYLYSVNYKGNASWHAVAGSQRGEIPNGYEVDGFLKESEVDAMQSRQPDGSIAINPIWNVNPWGLRIWGNRTALPNENNEELPDGLVASSFANIRILLCDIKKRLYQAARRYQFDNNLDVLWTNFTGHVNTLLEEMKQSYGISAYKWYREETDERAKLKANLVITPVYAVEDFDLTVTLTDTDELVVSE